jgi:outer membrane lipopolysaccharide assembly protein LptE/RlpB
MSKRYVVMMLAFLTIFLMGCGYTARSLLPSDYKSVYVDSFANKIKITAEQSNVRMYRGYRPGLEADITSAIIDKFLLDGNLKVADRSSASLILKGELVDFRKEPLRYDANDNIEEYRLILTVNMELDEVKTGKVVWKERSFSGETTYRTGGSLAKSESSALADATQDLARRVVERTVEGW